METVDISGWVVRTCMDATRGRKVAFLEESGPRSFVFSTKKWKMRNEKWFRSPVSKVRKLCSEIDWWKNSFLRVLRKPVYLDRDPYLSKHKENPYKMCPWGFREILLRKLHVNSGIAIARVRGYVIWIAELSEIDMDRFHMDFPYVCIFLKVPILPTAPTWSYVIFSYLPTTTMNKGQHWQVLSAIGFPMHDLLQ